MDARSAASPQSLFIASDHAGFALKEYFKEHRPNLLWCDLGPLLEERVDYPDFADKVSAQVAQGHGLGILICGSGQGMAMRANKYRDVRAALCWNTEVAELAREHNNANVLCLGGRLMAPELAVQILDIFLKTPFLGGRHQQRVDKLSTPPLYR